MCDQVANSTQDACNQGKDHEKKNGQNIGSDDDDQSEATKNERDALVNDLP